MALRIRIASTILRGLSSTFGQNGNQGNGFLFEGSGIDIRPP